MIILLILPTTISSPVPTNNDIVADTDPNISQLLVSHYDCSKQHNLRQFSLTRVEQCSQAPSSLEYTRVIASVYVRAKAKRLKAWTCEAYIKKERYVCSQTNIKYRRQDRTDYHMNTMERPFTLDPTECKLAIRNLNGTQNKQLNTFTHNTSFTYFNDYHKQHTLETTGKQPPFRIKELNTYHYGTFTYITNSQLIPDYSRGLASVCWDKYEYKIEKDSWSLIVREVEITYDDKENTLIYDGHILPCLHDDGFCKPTILTPYTIVWFPEDLCLIFTINSFIGKMSKIHNRYWLETEHFFNITYNKNAPPTYSSLPNDNSNSDQTRLSRFEIFPNTNFFCNKPTPLHKTQYPDLFVTYKEGFNMNTGKRNPLKLPQDEQFDKLSSSPIIGKIIKNANNEILFPSLNKTNSFATLDYDAHINTDRKSTRLNSSH